MKINKLKTLIADIFVKHRLSKNHAKICSEAIINAKFADVKKRFKEMYGGPGRI